MIDQDEPRLVLSGIVYPALEFGYCCVVFQILNGQAIWIPVLFGIVSFVGCPVRAIIQFYGVNYSIVIAAEWHGVVRYVCDSYNIPQEGLRGA